MQQDPMEEWRRLTTLYSEMGDIEIRDLVDQINDLMPNAQQILRDELKKRGIVEPGPSGVAIPIVVSAAARDRRTFSHFCLPQRKLPDAEQEEEEDDDGPREYTWKTLLCECQDLAEAKAVATMLMARGD